MMSTMAAAECAAFNQTTVFFSNQLVRLVLPLQLLLSLSGVFLNAQMLVVLCKCRCIMLCPFYYPHYFGCDSVGKQLKFKYVNAQFVCF